MKYALKLNTVANHLDPSMREEEILIYSSTYFASDISEIVDLYGIKTINQFTNYWTRIQRGRIKKEINEKEMKIKIIFLDIGVWTIILIEILNSETMVMYEIILILEIII